MQEHVMSWETLMALLETRLFSLLDKHVRGPRVRGQGGRGSCREVVTPLLLSAFDKERISKYDKSRLAGPRGGGRHVIHGDPSGLLADSLE